MANKTCPDCANPLTPEGAAGWRCTDCGVAVDLPPPDPVSAPTALDVQMGGGHYKDKPIQPVEYVHANGMGFCEGNVIKYVTRFRDKNGREDLEKARHYLDLLISLEYGE